jgi:hypothetical protein
MKAMYYLLPNLTNFDIRSEAANGVDVTTGYVAWALVYGTLYTSMLLALAAITFQDKDV